jgi:radical SAM protein with 4Fe4S-binding SPASM domain
MRGIEFYMRHAEPQRIPVIAVVTRASISRCREMFDFFKAIKAFVHLDIYDISCYDLEAMAEGKANGWADAPSPEEVGQFLIELFNLWFYDQSRSVDFLELREEVKMVLQPEISRGDPFHKKRCEEGRTIFAPTGKVYACDQYLNNDRTAIGDIHYDSLEDILKRKTQLWEEIKSTIRKSNAEMACASCEWGSMCGGGCITCMKYNALLLRSPGEGAVDPGKVLPTSFGRLSGETYYCDGLRAFRSHVKEAIQRELFHG